MGKYIIELTDGFSDDEGNTLYRAKGCRSLVFDEKGVENILTPFNKNPEYNRGYKEGYDRGHLDGFVKANSEKSIKLEPVKTTNVENTMEYQIGYRVGYDKGHLKGLVTCKMTNPFTEKEVTDIANNARQNGYNQGLEDVDHAIEVIKAMTGEECAEWFNDCIGLDEVICGFAVSRIIEITKAYEEKKKAEEEITRGDTVCFRGSPQTTFIVWDILDEADEGVFVYGFNQSGTYSSVNIKNVKKVNVPNRFDKITSILKELGE